MKNGSHDPVIVFKKRLLDSKTLTQSEIDTVEEIVKDEIEESVAFAMQGSVLPFNTIQDYVYAEE